MTAANLVVLCNCVHLVTDGLNSRDGAPHSVKHKVLPLPHLGVAVAVRGTRPAMGICWELISAGSLSLMTICAITSRPLFSRHSTRSDRC